MARTAWEILAQVKLMSTQAERCELENLGAFPSREISQAAPLCKAIQVCDNLTSIHALSTFCMHIPARDMGTPVHVLQH